MLSYEESVEGVGTLWEYTNSAVFTTDITKEESLVLGHFECTEDGTKTNEIGNDKVWGEVLLIKAPKASSKGVSYKLQATVKERVNSVTVTEDTIDGKFDAMLEAFEDYNKQLTDYKQASFGPAKSRLYKE